MSRKLAGVTALVAVVALAFVASATSSGTTTAAAQPAAATTGTTTQVGNASVRLTVKQFIRQGHRYYAEPARIDRRPEPGAPDDHG